MPRDVYTKEYKPRAQQGDLVLLLDSGAFVKGGSTSFWEVADLEPVPLVGEGGVVPIWTHTGNPVGGSPYALTGAEAKGAVAAGQSQKSGALLALQQADQELLQIRMVGPVVFGTLPVGWAVDDLDVQMYQPASDARWALENSVGVLNAKGASPLNDFTGTMPAQGTDVSAASISPGADPWEAAYMTETFVWERRAPAFAVLNRGSADMDSDMGVGLLIRAFKYLLRPVEGDGKKIAFLQRELVMAPGVSHEDLRWRVPVLKVSA